MQKDQSPDPGLIGEAQVNVKIDRFSNPNQLILLLLSSFYEQTLYTPCILHLLLVK
jgi:hypothetical protein